MKTKDAYFLIESGSMLQAVKTFITDFARAQDEAKAFIKELGVSRYVVSPFDMSLAGVLFEDATPPDGFKKVDKYGVSYPKRSSEWAKRFKAACPGIGESAERRILAIWPVPTYANYETEGGRGHCTLGSPFDSCGFLFPDEAGPYGLWVPDVIAELQERKNAGYRVTNIAEDYKLEFPGLKRISKDEWDLIVLQHKVAKQKQEQTPGAV